MPDRNPPNLRPPRPADLVALYHRYLRLDAQRYDLRAGFWRTYDIKKIKRAIDEAFAIREGVEYLHSTVFERASVLAKSLNRHRAFVHACDRVAIKTAIMVLERAGYSFSPQPVHPGETLAEYLERCSRLR